MQIVEKFRKILKKPMADPHREYIEELVAHIETNERGASKKVGNQKPDFKGKFYTPADSLTANTDE